MVFCSSTLAPQTTEELILASIVATSVFIGRIIQSCEMGTAVVSRLKGLAKLSPVHRPSQARLHRTMGTL